MELEPNGKVFAMHLSSISSQSLGAIGSLLAYFAYLSAALFLGPFVPFPPLYDYKGTPPWDPSPLVPRKVRLLGTPLLGT
jgi:hypothetical protein